MRQAERLRYLVLAAQRDGNRRLSAELRPLGLTSSQAEVLRILADHAPLTLSGLGRLLVCESGENPSRLVDRLVVAGLVERMPHSTDRRLVAVSLTAAGHALESRVRAIEEAMYEYIDAITADLDLEQVLTVLERLTAGGSAGAAVSLRASAS